MCRVKTDEDAGTYGDCLRASVASILDFENPENVPHFFHDNCDGATGHKRLRDWALTAKNLVPFNAIFEGSSSRNEILEHVEFLNPGVAFLLFGSTADGDHVVICQKGDVIHDTAWYKLPMTYPSSNGYWMVTVFIPADLLKS